MIWCSALLIFCAPEDTIPREQHSLFCGAGCSQCGSPEGAFVRKLHFHRNYLLPRRCVCLLVCAPSHYCPAWLRPFCKTCSIVVLDTPLIRKYGSMPLNYHYGKSLTLIFFFSKDAIEKKKEEDSQKVVQMDETESIYVAFPIFPKIIVIAMPTNLNLRCPRRAIAPAWYAC